MIEMLFRRIRIHMAKLKFTLCFLFYNSHCDVDYMIDCLFEPVYRFIDSYVRQLGRVFVGFLSGMIMLMVVITFAIVVPYEIDRHNVWEILAYLVVGQWLLINMVFNFYQGCRTPPGYPPQSGVLTSCVAMCKHCIQPKPARTHHCSVCRRCILKMDHHCPWLDQCVGHFNHRYYYLTMVFMWLSCLYVIYGMRCCFIENYWTTEDNPVPWCAALGSSSLAYAPWLCDGLMYSSDMQASGRNESVHRQQQHIVTILMLIEFLVCAATAVGLVWLIVSHTVMISKGETSIEYYINKQMKALYSKEGKVYANPYDFGWYENWKRFLGVDNLSTSLISNVLLPSIYNPRGDGTHWPLHTPALQG